MDDNTNTCLSQEEKDLIESQDQQDMPDVATPEEVIIEKGTC